MGSGTPSFTIASPRLLNSFAANEFERSRLGHARARADAARRETRRTP